MNKDCGQTGIIRPGFLAGVFVFLCGALVLGWLVYCDLPVGNEGTVTLDIAPGMTARDISRLLHDRGLIRSVPYFVLISRLHSYTVEYKAGRHMVDRSLRASAIARLLTSIPPPPQDVIITIAEGLSITEIASVLSGKAAIDSASFVRLATDREFTRELGVDKGTFEGYLYPETYYIRYDTGAREMIERMVRTFQSEFDDSLRRRAAKLHMTIHEVVILASIIETEAALDDERPLISSVFHHRLKLGRPLEANPTIQYALGTKRRVLREDLKIDSPYNTYTHRGLPPGPIASPGKKSLLAALYPADTNFLYFMADGTGGHVFSKTLDEHNNAVLQYKKLRKRMSNN